MLDIKISNDNNNNHNNNDDNNKNNNVPCDRLEHPQAI